MEMTYGRPLKPWSVKMDGYLTETHRSEKGSSWKATSHQPQWTPNLTLPRKVVRPFAVLMSPRLVICWARQPNLPHLVMTGLALEFARSSGESGIRSGWYGLLELASVYLGHLPCLWKTAKGVFSPKPGKPDYSKVRTYRVISLLDVIRKLVERAAAHLIADHLERRKDRNLHDGQFGCRKRRSCIDAMAESS